MASFQGILKNLPFGSLHIIKPQWSDIVEILVIAYMLFHILRWLRKTRAWSLFKGVLVILAFVAVAALFRMNTILWIIQNMVLVAALSIVVVLQPELRKALEDLGEKNFFSVFLTDNNRGADGGRFSDKTINEIVRACFEMGKDKTGALIVIGQNQPLDEYERTGITVDALVTSQLLINIFEKNTPLHDGAVIISGDRVRSATCYLPLSDNLSLPKHLGTRHRAGVGISEVTDSLTVIVSEESGRVSVAYKGQLETVREQDRLAERLREIQNKPVEEDKKKKRRKERAKDEA